LDQLQREAVYGHRALQLIDAILAGSAGSEAAGRVAVEE